MKLSRKGRELVELYSKMAETGYERTDGDFVDKVFSDFESRRFRYPLKEIFNQFGVRTVLDYGCGGSDWYLEGFDDSGASAVEFYQLKAAYRYEPARHIDERRVADCVISFDVLEHVFISDVPSVLRDMMQYAHTLLILNVACYPAAAKLPNGENAHITVRPPFWWKGMVDSVAIEFPDLVIKLGVSESYGDMRLFPDFGATMWEKSNTFVTAF